VHLTTRELPSIVLEETVKCLKYICTGKLNDFKAIDRLIIGFNKMFLPSLYFSRKHLLLPGRLVDHILFNDLLDFVCFLCSPSFADPLVLKLQCLRQIPPSSNLPRINK
jgi:hypothetical protein